MGDQPCVLYGAAEFSRDTDLAILGSDENAERLTKAMADLEAGHAVHFCCRHPEVAGMRVDVMSRMRGVTDFHNLAMDCNVRRTLS